MTGTEAPRPALDAAAKRVPRGAPLLEVGVVAALLLVALLGPGPVLMGSAVLVVLLLLLRRPQWSVLITFLLAFTTFPGAVQTDFTVAGYTLHAFEPFLVFATIWALLRLRAPAWSNVVSFGIAAVVLTWAAYGVLQHNPPAKVIFDIRPLGHLVAASIIAARVASLPVARWIRTALPVVLWFSAAMTMLASTTGFAINGSSEQATLFLGDATSEATRLRGPTTDLALLVLAACIALFIAAGPRRRRLAVLAVPAFLIVFLAFSRYTVIGVGFALLLSLIAGRSLRSVFRAGVLAGIVVVLGLLIGAASPRIAALPGGDWVVTQVSGFQGRVLGGLTGQVISEDGSAQFRFTEDSYLTPQFERAPFLGHGFGFAYKPPEGTADGIFAVYAPYYAHNWYLWILVKSGVIGTGLLLSGLLLPVAVALRRPTPRRLVLAVAVGVLMVNSIVAPMPNGDSTATLLGTALGLLVLTLAPRIDPWRPRRRRSSSEPPKARPMPPPGSLVAAPAPAALSAQRR